MNIKFEVKMTKKAMFDFTKNAFNPIPGANANGNFAYNPITNVAIIDDNAVAVNIEENLPQMQRTAVNIRVRNDGFVLFVLPLNAGFFGAADDNGNDIAGQLHQTDALVREDGRALLQLAHLQHIVDERHARKVGFQPV